MDEPAHGEWPDGCGAWRAAGEGKRRCRRHVFYIRSSAGCQRFLAANRWIGNRHAVTTVMRGKLMATSQHAGQLVARRTDEFVRRVADECERQVAELSARAAGPRGRVAVDRAKTEAELSGELNGGLQRPHSVP